ncbi:MAG: MBL fold metallo-hydrolase [Crocinitomicaceae bacterium]|nr:MBL fold metallo-hydrolase [Crocinitomicaceae bacterium]
MVHVQGFTFNPFQENSYIVYNDQKEAVIIDPGCYTREEQAFFLEYIQSNGLKPLALLNTHCHIDHILGNAFVLRNFELDFYAHELDLPTLQMGELSAKMYGMSEYETSPKPTKFIQDKEVLQFGNIQLDVIFGPGHAPGHVAFYNAASNILLGGDILFKGSFGRYDLPGGSLEVLKKSITERLFTLPENTVVYSGHGPATSIGEEKSTNPILSY